MSSSTEHVPIPPPSHPRQYRAIGLIEGQYQRSAERMTRGTLIKPDGTRIEAVILGKVISVLKNHVDLEKSHLWVVYPRTRKDQSTLHLQITGVWEPEILNTAATSKDATVSDIPIESGYFSIRGEVIYSSQAKNTVIVKIRQSPKRPSEKPKFFKLKLKGQLPDKAVGHFWDLHVRLQGDTLIIQTGSDLGYVPKKKPIFRRQKSASPSPPKKPTHDSDYSTLPKKSLERPTKLPRHQSLPKPKKSHRSNSQN